MKNKLNNKLWIIIPLIAIGAIILLGILIYFGVRLYAKSAMLPKDIANKDPESIAKYCEQKQGFDKDQCYFEVALLVFNDSKYSDGRYCLKISYEQQKDTCILAYAGWWNNSDLCSQPQIAEMRIVCMAIVKRDASLCEQITNENVKNLCINQVNALSSPIENDKSTCLRGSDVNDRDDCFYYLAYKYKNYTICMPIVNESLQTSCIAGNLYYHFQNNRCADLQGKDKDLCFLYSATIEKNKTVCDSIQNTTWRGACITNLNS